MPLTPVHLYPGGVRASPKAKGYGVSIEVPLYPVAKGEGVRGDRLWRRGEICYANPVTGINLVVHLLYPFGVRKDSEAKKGVILS